MSTYVNATAAGHGSHSLGGPTTIDYVYAQLVTPADLTTFGGFSPVRRVHHLGWVGFGFVAAGTFPDYLNFGSFIDYEAINFQGSALNAPFADTVYWDVFPSGVVYIEVGFH